jgi:hypothetical protein
LSATAASEALAHISGQESIAAILAASEATKIAAQMAAEAVDLANAALKLTKSERA